MAAYTVFHYHGGTLVDCLNNLFFASYRENGGVTHAIFAFKVIFAENIVLGYMTIVACGVSGVRTVIPGGIKRRHDMAVYTRGGIIGQITGSPGGVHCVESESADNTKKQDGINLPSPRGENLINEFGYLHTDSSVVVVYNEVKMLINKQLFCNIYYNIIYLFLYI